MYVLSSLAMNIDYTLTISSVQHFAVVCTTDEGLWKEKGEQMEWEWTGSEGGRVMRGQRRWEMGR